MPKWSICTCLQPAARCLYCSQQYGMLCRLLLLRSHRRNCLYRRTHVSLPPCAPSAADSP